MFGLFNKGKAKADEPPSQQQQQAGDGGVVAVSAAANALAAAASSNAPALRPAGPKPAGRGLRGEEVAIDLSSLRPNESVVELQVQPITLLKYDYKLEHSQQVAVSDTFICYGLKAGHIRALNRATADRALFKGHPAPLSHMAFFGPDAPLLASASRRGDLAVRQLTAAPAADGGEGTIAGATLLAAQLPGAAAAAAGAADGAVVALAWHPTVCQILAAAAGDSVCIYEVPTAAPAGGEPLPAAPGITYSLGGGAGGASVTTVAFSPTGDLLVAGDSSGSVRVWWVEGGEDAASAPLLAWPPFGAAAGAGGIGSVAFLHQAPDGSSLLLTGDGANAALKLWALPPAAAGRQQQPRCLQSVVFSGNASAEPFFCQVAVQRDLQLVVLANTPHKQVYTLHYSLSPDSSSSSSGQFDYAAFFAVKQPILSLSTILDAAAAEGESADVSGSSGSGGGQALMLYCVQTDAIQQYTLNPSLCIAAPGGDDEADAAAAAAAAAAAEAAAVPPPATLPAPTLLGARAKGASKAAASNDTHAADAQQQQQQLEAQASGSSAASTESEDTAAVQAAVDSVQDVAAAAAATPPPPLPTTNLLHSAEKVAAAATLAGVAAVAHSSLPARAGGDGPLEQQMQQLLVMQQQLAAQLQASSQQTVAGIKAELTRSSKASEAALLKQIDAALKAAAKKGEEERRKAAAKERADLEKALGAQLAQTAAGLQRDLARVVGDASREQGRSMVNAIVTSVTPVVASAVASSVQQELAGAAGPGGSLQAALEGSLATSLARPLHDALRSNFEASLIPAFERATQAMFQQVDAAFSAWLADSSSAVAASQAEAAASLSASLSQLQALVGTMRGELADTSRSLSRMASSAASRGDSGALGAGAPGGAAGGAAAVDPRTEISGLLAARSHDAALVRALNTASLDTLLWTCKQMDPAQVLGSATSSLSQTTLLSLVSQLAVNLRNDADAGVKLAWLAEAGPVIDPHDRATAPHIQGVLTAVLNSLKSLLGSLPPTDALARKGKITLHLFNSLLHQ